MACFSDIFWDRVSSLKNVLQLGIEGFHSKILGIGKEGVHVVILLAGSPQPSHGSGYPGFPRFIERGY